jgi:hypothetical protein
MGKLSSWPQEFAISYACAALARSVLALDNPNPLHAMEMYRESLNFINVAKDAANGKTLEPCSSD